MNKVLSITRKTLRELLRNRRTLLLAIGFPLAFMLIFGLAFGKSSATTFDVAVINEDAGALGAKYVEGLAALKYGDGKTMIAVHNATRIDAAKTDLGERKVALVLRVPSNFTAGLTPPPQNPNTSPVPVGQASPQRGPPPPGAQVDLVFDIGSPNSQAASQIVDGYTQAFAAAASGQAPLVRAERSTVTSKDLSGFDFIAPGLMVYAVLNMAPQAAALLAHESETRTLERLKLSRMSTLSLLLGVSLGQLIIALVSLSLMLAMALALGFHPQGSLLVGLVAALFAAMAAIGVGMIIASFAKRKDDAANLAVFFVVPASFLSGAFFPLQAVTLFTLGGHAIGSYDWLPSTHAIKALRAILTLGQSVSSVAFELGALVLLTVLYFALGAWLFTQRRMRTG